jgi:hypothetical protein
VTSNPGGTYQARLAERRASAARLSRRDERISLLRLAVFGAGFLLLVLWWRGSVGAGWLALPLVAFGVLVRLHDRVIGARDAAVRAAAYYERGLARIEDRWAGEGERGDRFRDDHHPYATDLDIFGDGSLFQLLSAARTRAGEERLAAWLKVPASPSEVAGRQAAVAELADQLELREDVALAGSAVAASVHSETLTAWAEGSPRLRRRWLRGVAAALTTAAVAAAADAYLSGRYEWLTAVLFAEVIFFLPQRRRIQQALHAAGAPARDLDVLAHVLGRLERETFSAPLLAALRRRLDTHGRPASSAIRRLHRLIELHDWQHNLFFAPVAAAMLWGTHLAFAIERWRALHGAEVRAWLEAVGEFEALVSLAAFRYEHPGDAWPELVAGEAFVDATALGHPLIPAARLVRNDVRLGGETRLWLVSGSNMSGKSTLLRTIGITVVLAQAGAPVRAASLRLSPLAIGATLRIQDSLQEGRSRFYAEITRLREIADAARGPVPVLFLLDELFHGTNSHDRLAGASGVLRSLLDRGAIGLVTTHDLALTAVTDALAPRAANVHFEDRFEGGAMSFDYRVKPGPVTRSNAIALMRAVGLDVENI